MIDALAPITATFIFSQYSGGRALPAEQLAAIARAAGVDTQAYRQAPSLDEAIEIGLALASNSEPLLITGSIFTAGEARTILQDRHGVPPLRF
jgi:folylpolyglutamate synthase/dihydropteroate synthase